MKKILNKLFGSSSNKEESREAKRPQKTLWSPVNYNLLFDSQTYEGRTLIQKRVGEFKMESGWIIASDPFFLSHILWSDF
jgi:hypothetical protein